MYTEFEREKVVEYLSGEMDRGRRLIIVDPYFLCKGKRQRIEEYIQEIDRVINSYEEILIFTHTHNYREKEKNEEHKRNEERIINFLNEDRAVKIIKTSRLHDRLWIKDGKDYYVVGSSFNGIGFSFGFIYKLVEPETYIRIREYLEKKIMNNTSLSREQKNENSDFMRNILSR